MITQIGITAGEIWQYLDQKQTATMEELTGEITQSREVILMSLGWLAREGHITVKLVENSFTCKLTEKNPA